MTRTAFMKILGAVAVIALCIGACCACDAVFEPNGSNDEALSSSGAQSISTSRLETVKALLNDEGSDAASAAANFFDLSIEAGLPASFVQEALDPAAFEETFTSGSTMSLTYPGSCTEAAAYCTRVLESKGWYALDQNNEVTSSFAKTEGVYRWLVLQYLAIDDKTVVLATMIDPS